MYLNLGDLGENIKDYVEEYQSKTQSNRNIDSIADMKRFIEEYPEFRRLSGNVTKHATLLGELSRLVKEQDLLTVSELEQSLACNDRHANDLKVSELALPSYENPRLYSTLWLAEVTFQRTVSLMNSCNRGRNYNV
jgi:hypothetical protein